MIDPFVLKFSNHSWMSQGTPNQQLANKTLEKLNIFADLKEYGPVIAGTIPIDVDVSGSDIDILCNVIDFDRFQKRIRELFETQKNFLITENFLKRQRFIMCRFEFDNFRIEVFGQNCLSQEQNAFLHMVAEAKLLELGGDEARVTVRNLKAQGYKTEPAFAQHFSIEGDPYEMLAEWAKLPLAELAKKVKVPSS